MKTLLFSYVKGKAYCPISWNMVQSSEILRHDEQCYGLDLTSHHPPCSLHTLVQQSSEVGLLGSNWITRSLIHEWNNHLYIHRLMSFRGRLFYRNLSIYLFSLHPSLLLPVSHEVSNNNHCSSTTYPLPCFSVNKTSKKPWNENSETGAKRNLSFSKLISLGILSQWWKAV